MKDYKPSPYYRTGNMRIAPWYFGIMRAEEEWRRDHYDGYNGIVSGFNTRWKGVERLPSQVSDGIYGYVSGPYSKEDPYRRKWRNLIYWFSGMGIKDNPPISPAEVSRFHRNRDREAAKQQALADERPSDDD